MTLRANRLRRRHQVRLKGQRKRRRNGVFPLRGPGRRHKNG